MTLLALLILVVVASLIIFGIRSAPDAIISGTFKPILVWVIIVIVVIIIISNLLGGSDLLNYRIGGK